MIFAFEEFELDEDLCELRRHGVPIKLEPRPFEVLCHLVRNRCRVVSRDELFAQLWADVVVSDTALSSAIKHIRHALSDDAAMQKYIATLRRRGFRFVASAQERVAPQASGASHRVTGATPLQARAGPLVGRDAELDRLSACWERARAGERQVVFVSGEFGIGKTALLQTFLSRAAAGGNGQIAVGRCIEHYGPGETYLPIIEALTELGRGPRETTVVGALLRHAPAFLLGMPSLLPDDRRESLRRTAFPASREKSLREITEAIETLASAEPLVLALEDLHWSDYSTLDCISLLSQRRMPVPLLVIGTYRAADALRVGHPLQLVARDLHERGTCEEVQLRLLDAAATAEYLSQRFQSAEFPEDLAPLILRLTGGNPLFIVSLVDALIAEGAIGKSAGVWSLRTRLDDLENRVPSGLRELIGRHIERLESAELRLLEAASVVGLDFACAAVAALTSEAITATEERCEALARRREFLRADGLSEWPDGTVTGRYAFTHSLFRSVLYDRIGAARRMQLHRRIAEQAEAAFGPRAGEIAAPLATHFELGHDSARAVQYYRQAGENALRRGGCREAVGHLTKALELFRALPDASQRPADELALHMALSVPLVFVDGQSAPRVEKLYERARELCAQLGEVPEVFPVLHAKLHFHIVRAETDRAREIGEQMLLIAERVGDPAFVIEAHMMLGAACVRRGEFAECVEHEDEVAHLFDPAQHGNLLLQYGEDAAAFADSQAALALWHLGYPDQALERSCRSMARAEKVGMPSNVVGVTAVGVGIRLLRREAEAAQALLDATRRVAAEEGFAFFLAHCSLLQGWILVQQADYVTAIAKIQDALAAFRSIGAGIYERHALGLLAEALGKTARLPEALEALERAFASLDTTGERWAESALCRLRGELSLRQENRTAAQEAERWFRRAIDVARRQGAKLPELRATVSLARLRGKQRARGDARTMLTEICGWFTEGAETIDLREAKGLLRALGSH